MAYAMTKRGSLDNCITYEFICDTVQDMNAIEDGYRTIGTVAIVLSGADEGLEVYMSGSNHEWVSLSSMGTSGGGTTGGLSIYICAQNEVSNGLPNIQDPDETTIYLVASGNESGNLYEEYIYVDDAWEKFGSGGTTIDLSGYAPIANPAFTGSISMGRQGNTTVGQYSVAIGAEVTASGVGSYAEGSQTNSSGIGSHAEGGNTIASGFMAHAEGYSTSASGAGSHAEGYGALDETRTIDNQNYNYGGAYGQSSHAEGIQVLAIGLGSHAEGFKSVAFGEYDHAEGYDTFASGTYGAHAEGYQTQASNYCAHAEGYLSVASGAYAHAEGYGTAASGDYSAHAEGEDTTASGYSGAHAEGYETTASGDYGSHAEGYYTQASGSYGAHAEGAETSANGEDSHAEGSYTSADGKASHTEGVQTRASGDASHASGTYNIADSYTNWSNWAPNTAYQVGDKVKHTISGNTEGYICKTTHTSGSSFTGTNWINHGRKMNYVEIIGNGTTDNARSNARALDWDGNEHLKGDVYVNCNADSTGGTKLIGLPTPPVSDGTYTLQVIVSSGTATYSWVGV